MMNIGNSRSLTLETLGNPYYNGVGDTNRGLWFNESTLRGTYSYFNNKYFSSSLPNLSFFLIINTTDSWYARTYTDLVDTQNNNQSVSNVPYCEWCESYRVVVTGIVFRNFNWRDRFQLENALIHEMCHVWQVYNGIDQNPYKLMVELMCDNGHGGKFKEIAEIITSLSKDDEGFVVTCKSSGDEG